MMSSPTALIVLQKIFAIERKIFAVHRHFMLLQILFCHLSQIHSAVFSVTNSLLTQAYMLNQERQIIRLARRLPFGMGFAEVKSSKRHAE